MYSPAARLERTWKLSEHEVGISLSNRVVRRVVLGVHCVQNQVKLHINQPKLSISDHCIIHTSKVYELSTLK
jgi:hypothetical protein